MQALKAECLSVQRPGHPLRVLSIPGVDIAVHAQVAEAVRKVNEAFGCVDIVVNNAGIAESSCLIAESDPDEWWRTWEVNVRGSNNINVARAFLPSLIQCGGDKTILNVASIGALIVMPAPSAYMR